MEKPVNIMCTEDPKDEEGFNTIVDKVLIGTFDTEEEARAFQNALNRKLAEQNG